MIGKTVGHYKIVDKLGEGGMGAVYKAEDTTLRRLVALKTLSSHLAENEEARERFVREAQAASALNHSNITTVHELLEDEGEQFIVMEYLEGKTIRDIVESGHVSFRKALDIIIQTAEALEAAHNKGILHRDIKSANIMVSMEGNVKVMDFGLAHLEDRSQLTRTGTTMGTLSYSSPEQISGRPIDRRSEVFSLGIIFYELLTGQLPFRATSEAGILFAIINNEPTRISQLRDNVPELVEAAVSKMLEKDSGRRYQTCADVIHDLQGIRKEMETSTVGITGALERVLAREKRRTIAAVTAGIVAVAGLMAFYLFVLALKPTGPPRLAVLPFEERGPAVEEYFASSLADEIQSRLAALSGLDVIQFYGADQYEIKGKTPRQIGNDLGVDYLLTANVQRENLPNNQTNVRLLPKLTRASDGKVLPVKTCEGMLAGAGIFQLQADLAEQVTEALDVVLLDSEKVAIEERPTENQEAYDLYLRGQDYFRGRFERENAQTAIEIFERSVELDPDFALAYTELSRARIWFRWTFSESEELRLEAKEAVDKALSLNPDLPAAHLALGDYYYYGSRDYEKAVEQYQLVLELQPNDAEARAKMGWIRRRQGRWEEAVGFFRRALELDPRYYNILYGLGHTYSRMRLYSDAEYFLGRAISLFPDLPNAYEEMAMLHLLWEGNRVKARQFLEENIDIIIPNNMDDAIWAFSRILRRVFPEHFDAVRDRQSDAVSPRNYIARASIAAYRNQTSLAIALYDSARIILELEYQGQSNSRASLLGLVHAGLGNKGEAIRYGEQAVDLLPVTKDAFAGTRGVEILAEICVTVGDYEAAIDRLEYLLSIPSQVSVPLIRIDPIWDPLRDHPRFQELLRKYKP